MDFLRRCPARGKRFVVKVEKKSVVDTEQDSEHLVRYAYVGNPVGSRSSYLPPVMVRTEADIPIERETFQVTYVCKNCSHEWSENMTAVHKT